MENPVLYCLHSTVGETWLNAAMKDAFTSLSQFLSSLSVFLTKYYLDDQLKENAMRRRYGAMEMYSRFCCGTLMERDHKEHLVVDGRLIFTFISKEQDWRAWPVLTLRLLMSYIYGAPSKARNVNVVYILTYVWQR